tara:strand:+ start:4780 stop:4968 length:189 start_codon:yes stop_codon:yes gene_type:complete
MKKYKVKDLKRVNKDGYFTLVKKWFKNGVEKVKIVNDVGWEYICETKDLEEIKTKSNKKNKK